MTEESPSYSHGLHGNLLQIGSTMISTSGRSIVIYKGMDLEDGRERQIFHVSPVRHLLPIHDPLGVKVGEKSFLLALGARQLALFRLKKRIPLVTFDVDDEIVGIGAITSLNIERAQRKKEEVFRVRLAIPIAYRSGTLKIEKLTVDYSDDGGVKKSLKTNDEIECKGQQMKFCVNLTDKTMFGIFEDTVVKSDGAVIRAGEVSLKKKRRIVAVGSELWNGNVLLATENGTIRVVQVVEGERSKLMKDRPLTMLSSGQCVAPHCTLRCREPAVIISAKEFVIVGTRRGEIHCLNEQLQLTRKFDTEGGPIDCLKLDQSDSDFLFVGYESGELRRINLLTPDENESRMEEDNVASQENIEDVKMEIEEEEEKQLDTSKSKSARKSLPLAKKSDTELKCPACEFRTRAVLTLTAHLNRIHSTNAHLAGIVFRCECGNESKSELHTRYCTLANITVVRRIDGPIKTFHDAKTTPKCILCKTYPKTALGYAVHLEHNHKSTLKAQGIYCVCSCGTDIRSHTVSPSHTKKCDGRKFTLHSLDKN